MTHQQNEQRSCDIILSRILHKSPVYRIAHVEKCDRKILTDSTVLVVPLEIIEGEILTDCKHSIKSVYIGGGTTQAGQVLAGPLSGRFLLFRLNQKLIPPRIIICIVL